MPKRGTLTNSKQTADRPSVQGRRTVFWDREPPGFGVRVYSHAILALGAGARRGGGRGDP